MANYKFCQGRQAGTPIAHTRHAFPVICSEGAGEESVRNKLDEGDDGRRCGLQRGAVSAKPEGSLSRFGWEAWAWRGVALVGSVAFRCVWGCSRAGMRFSSAIAEGRD